MIVLIGKTASGKDTICNELIKRGYEKIITYTTRPIRPGETNGVTYNFISEEEFLENKWSFNEYKKYETVYGVWYYGSILPEDLSKKVIILTPDGYEDILPYVLHEKERGTKITAFYIYANNKTIKRRLMKRGDNKDEAERRLLHDNEDFKGVEAFVDKIVYNNWDESLDNVVDKIIECAGE